MPYGYRKEGDKITVFKKKPDGSTEVVGHTTASKLKGYLAALHIHSKDMNEADIMDPKEKALTKSALQKDIEAKKLALKNAEDKLKNLKEFSLSKYIKTVLEAEGDAPEDAPEDAASMDAPDDKGAGAEDAPAEDETDSKASKPDNLTVKFNMAQVMKYNQYPVTDNTGTVTGVTKHGMSVQVGDNIIFVDFKDLLD